ncbi:MAG TPA: hypothetical protein EYH06_06030 [Chromatiales bacterium]|nr:hypothetical protein [Thiotrichales bacterium]HIP68138.1 hypothetical protein [Chromatiales bacterium]
MAITVFKATGIWLLIVIAAIFNGVFRERVLVPAVGADLALPLSGVLLAVLVFLVTLLLISFIGSSKQNTYIYIGLLWVVLTLSFEFLFGHFVVGKPWHEIIQVFNIRKGDLFIVVLFITGISPWLAARIRGVF